MTKSSIALILVCVLAGCGFYLWGQKAETDKRAMSIDGPCGAGAQAIYLTKPIRAGEVLKAEDLVEKPIDFKQCPATAFTSASTIVGMKAKVDMRDSQMVLVGDVTGESDAMVEQSKLKQEQEKQERNWGKDEQKSD